MSSSSLPPSSTGTLPLRAGRPVDPRCPHRLCIQRVNEPRRRARLGELLPHLLAKLCTCRPPDRCHGPSALALRPPAPPGSGAVARRCLNTTVGSTTTRSRNTLTHPPCHGCITIDVDRPHRTGDQISPDNGGRRIVYHSRGWQRLGLLPGPAYDRQGRQGCPPCFCSGLYCLGLRR